MKIMKLFKNATLAAMKLFLAHSSFSCRSRRVYRRVALLSCLAARQVRLKKALIEQKIFSI